MKRARRRQRAAAALVCLGWAVAVLSGAKPAGAGDSSALRIRGVQQSADGQTSIVVSLSGPAAQSMPDAAGFSVIENGTSYEPSVVERYVGSRSRPIAVAIVMDVSGSMKGEALIDAKAAATTLVDSLPDQVLSGLVVFDSSARVALPFTTDRARMRSAIAGLSVGGETALYDAAVLAVRQMTALNAQANLVILSDGADTSSVATLQSAQAAAKEAKASITALALNTAELDAQALESLAAATRGSFVPIARSADLLDAFRSAATDISSQVVVVYEGGGANAAELDIRVDYTAAGQRLSDGAVVLNEREGNAAPQPAALDAGSAPFAMLILGVGLLGLGAAALLTVVLGRGRQRGEFALDRAVAFYSPDRRAVSDGGRAVSIDFRGGVRSLVDVLPKPKGYEAAIDAKLERAAWPLRTSEFLAIRGACAFGAFLFVWLATQRSIIAAILAVPAWFVPRFLLDRRIDKRNTAFNDQLPDTLQLLASSLEAGYGVLQGLETIVREARPPTSQEFGRTLAEIRLGIPVHDALESMADRIGGDDFRWVVMSMNIQREVGGNLVQILRTVSETIRERGKLLRNVKTLSAEGRLSAVILGALPFALSLYIALVNPTYLGTLFGSVVGRVLIAGSIALMGAGAMWLRKIIRINV